MRIVFHTNEQCEKFFSRVVAYDEICLSSRISLCDGSCVDCWKKHALIEVDHKGADLPINIYYSEAERYEELFDRIVDILGSHDICPSNLGVRHKDDCSLRCQDCRKKAFEVREE